MSDLAVHFSSKTDEWETPWDFFEEINTEFNFTVDVCATVQNTKCAQWFDKKLDGLKQSWPPCACWMNPPYGREISKWVKKAYESSLNGSIVVCLLPSRTDTKWWHDYCMKGEIRFIRGRLKFGCSKNSAPFPSAVVIFSPDKHSASLGNQQAGSFIPDNVQDCSHLKRTKKRARRVPCSWIKHRKRFIFLC